MSLDWCNIPLYRQYPMGPGPLLLIIFNIIILSFVVQVNFFVIPNISIAIGILIWILFILEVGPKCFLFITDKIF